MYIEHTVPATRNYTTHGETISLGMWQQKIKCFNCTKPLSYTVKGRGHNNTILPFKKHEKQLGYSNISMKLSICSLKKKTKAKRNNKTPARTSL